MVKILISFFLLLFSINSSELFAEEGLKPSAKISFNDYMADYFNLSEADKRNLVAYNFVAEEKENSRVLETLQTVCNPAIILDCVVEFQKGIFFDGPVNTVKAFASLLNHVFSITAGGNGNVINVAKEFEDIQKNPQAWLVKNSTKIKAILKNINPEAILKQIKIEVDKSIVKFKQLSDKEKTKLICNVFGQVTFQVLAFIIGAGMAKGMIEGAELTGKAANIAGALKVSGFISKTVKMSLSFYSKLPAALREIIKFTYIVGNKSGVVIGQTMKNYGFKKIKTILEFATVAGLTVNLVIVDGTAYEQVCQFLQLDEEKIKALSKEKLSEIILSVSNAILNEGTSLEENPLVTYLNLVRSILAIHYYNRYKVLPEFGKISLTTKYFEETIDDIKNYMKKQWNIIIDDKNPEAVAFRKKIGDIMFSYENNPAAEIMKKVQKPKNPSVNPNMVMFPSSGNLKKTSVQPDAETRAGKGENSVDGSSEAQIPQSEIVPDAETRAEEVTRKNAEGG